MAVAVNEVLISVLEKGSTSTLIPLHINPQTNTPQKPQKLCDELVNYIFESLRSNYHNAWKKAYPTEEAWHLARKHWSRGLSGLTRYQVVKAVDACWQEYPMPPTGSQFRVLAQRFEDPVTKNQREEARKQRERIMEENRKQGQIRWLEERYGKPYAEILEDFRRQRAELKSETIKPREQQLLENRKEGQCYSLRDIL